jgi:hypothetical protein
MREGSAVGIMANITDGAVTTGSQTAHVSQGNAYGEGHIACLAASTGLAIGLGALTVGGVEEVTGIGDLAIEGMSRVGDNGGLEGIVSRVHRDALPLLGGSFKEDEGGARTREGVLPDGTEGGR